MKGFLKIVYTALIIISITVLSCKKDTFYEGSGAELKFSTDTVSFDTVFSSQASITKRLMVYNPYNQKINIEAIELHGNNTPFILNINGEKGNTGSNIEISPNDSLYIFVTVFVNPTKQDSPLFISDSLAFTVNGNTQFVRLIAYGQDVNLIKGGHIKTQLWGSAKPYLLIGNVTVDSLETLTIEKGATLYFQKNANLLVNGTLKVLGEFGKPVRFRGSRLDKDYNDIPGQWGGIQISPGSMGNQVYWTVIENGTSGMALGAAGNNHLSELEITNSIIKNMSHSCFVANAAKVKAVNCVFANAAVYTCGLMGGGNYEFYHSTLVNYYGLFDSRSFSTPTLYISNFFYGHTDLSKKISANLAAADFYNCMVYGSNTEELQLDSVSTAQFRYRFENCLLKSKTYNLRTTGPFLNNIWNKTPKFINATNMDFRPDTVSVARNAGNVQIGKLYPKDLNNADRTLDVAPDIGAYEFVEKKK